MFGQSGLLEYSKFFFKIIISSKYLEGNYKDANTRNTGAECS